MALHHKLAHVRSGRPDQHVAYRADAIPADSVAKLRRVMTAILAL